jgi:hypothetical protein
MIIEDLNLQAKINQLAAEMSAALRTIGLLQNQLKEAKTQEQSTNINAQIIQQQAAYAKAKAEFDVRLELTHNPKQAVVPSPISGTVVTFDPVERLERRFVKPGDPLLLVARLDGAWEILLTIPEKHVGHVREALFKSELGYLEVDLLLASHPDRTYKGKLYRDGLAGEAVLENNEPVLQARVEIDENSIPREMLNGLLVSAEVRAKVRCGHRALGYVLFYELWEFIFEKILF